MHACIADVIADTTQNSIEAGAKLISVTITRSESVIAVEIADNGKGMDEATAKRAFDPFYTEPGKHSKRKVGLGLPMLKQICDSCGGGVTLSSQKGVGTTLKYHFDARNIDLPPMGDLPAVLLTLFNYPGDFELALAYRSDAGEFEIRRSELSDAVGGLDSVEGLALAEEFLRSNIQ